MNRKGTKDAKNYCLKTDDIHMFICVPLWEKK